MDGDDRVFGGIGFGQSQGAGVRRGDGVGSAEEEVVDVDWGVEDDVACALGGEDRVLAIGPEGRGVPVLAGGVPEEVCAGAVSPAVGADWGLGDGVVDGVEEHLLTDSGEVEATGLGIGGAGGGAAGVAGAAGEEETVACESVGGLGGADDGTGWPFSDAVAFDVVDVGRVDGWGLAGGDVDAWVERVEVEGGEETAAWFDGIGDGLVCAVEADGEELDGGAAVIGWGGDADAAEVVHDGVRAEEGGGDAGEDWVGGDVEGEFPGGSAERVVGGGVVFGAGVGRVEVAHAVGADER